VHLHPYYRKTFGYKEGDFPNAEWIGNATMSLPLSAKLQEEDVQDVIAVLRQSLGEE
jgi:dTDP-4-amino-4,6-dideoxygalactose transaminase